LTARNSRLHTPTISLNGVNQRLARYPGFIEVDLPFLIEPRPFQVNYVTINIPLWVRLEVLDSNSNNIGNAEVHIVEGERGLFADRMPLVFFGPIELSVMADELKHPGVHRLYFLPNVKKERPPGQGLPPSVVDITFAEYRRNRILWKKLRAI
jgi:hypothetical protein